MTNSTNRVEIITSVQRCRRWTAPEKVRMVEETFEPGMTVSLVARRHGVAANQPTITRLTRTRLSDIVHRVSSSQLTQDPDRVRSFGGYNSARRGKRVVKATTTGPALRRSTPGTGREEKRGAATGSLAQGDYCT